MVYITGDLHADFRRLSSTQFPWQKGMTRDDFVIVCGDFGGVWDVSSTPREEYWLSWLEDKSFTLLFVDGNHENFDRLNAEFEVVEFCGGKAHRIRDNVYHLRRGNIYEICGKKIFAFGGASSHDIEDGVIDPKDYETIGDALRSYRNRTRAGQQLRINHISWWREELPSYAEMQRGIQNLEQHGYQVDYVISHCLPQTVAATGGFFKPDALTEYFDELIFNGLTFKEWHCGHYHKDIRLLDKYYIHYHGIERLV